MGFLQKFFAPASWLDNTIRHATGHPYTPDYVAAHQANFQKQYGVPSTSANYRTVSGGYGFGSPGNGALVSAANTRATPNEVFSGGPLQPGDQGYTAPANQSVPAGTTNTSQAPGTAGVSAPPNQGFLQFFNGNWYSDPAQYYDAINQEVDRQYNQSIDQANTQTGTQKTNFLQQVADALDQLNTQATSGRNDINSYYSGLGDIYQSSQGTRTNQFNNDVTKQQGQIDTQKTQGLSSIDQALNDYLTQAATTRQGALNQNYNDANAIAQQLASGGIGSYSTYNPQLGQTQVQDTSSLLASLHNLLSQQNVNKHYNVPVGNKAPIYSYLSPQG